MAVQRKRVREPEAPAIRAGDCQGEILGTVHTHFGRLSQDEARSREFSYMTLPIALMMPGSRAPWPGVLIIITPARMKKPQGKAGVLIRGSSMPTLMLSLEVSRPQYSDMLRMFEVKRFRSFHFTVAEPDGKVWPIRSWGMSATLD